jgi:hypothetical protein
MDPKRSQTPEEISPGSEANKQPAEPSVIEGIPVTPTEAKTSPADVENAATDGQVSDADATTGAVDPVDLFSSLDTGVQALLDAVPDARPESLAIETAADNVSASAQSFVQDAFAPPAIEEIVASLPAAPISDVTAATIARNTVATWQDMPAGFGSHQDNATADRRKTTHDSLSESNPQSAPASVDVGGFMATEPVEPPAEANEEFDTFDPAPRANPADYIAIDNFLGPSNDPTVIQRGPVRTDGDSWGPSVIQLASISSDPSAPGPASGAELSPRATALQSLTSDGGPPLARPILMASVPDEQTRQLLDEALAEAGQRDAKTAAEIAQQQVDDAFWLRACEERALYGGR